MSELVILFGPEGNHNNKWGQENTILSLSQEKTGISKVGRFCSLGGGKNLARKSIREIRFFS